MVHDQLRKRASLHAKQILFATTLTAAALAFIISAKAQNLSHPQDSVSAHHMMMLPPPVGVPGAHMPPAGKTMSMYSSRWVHNDGLLAGGKKVSPEWVVLNVPNVNAPPPQVRRVPLSSNIHMQMFGFAHGLTDWLSVSVGSMYLNKQMKALTFAGMSGTTRLGTRTDVTEGLGDSRVAVNVRLFKERGHVVHAGLGISIPTGSIEENIRPLLPSNTIGFGRAGYMLQLGTGTYDLLPSLTWLGTYGPAGFGLAYRGRIALEDENSEGYRWGNLHSLSVWLSYAMTPSLTGSLRLEASMQDSIHGKDPLIAGAGVGANPDNIGGERLEAFLGLNMRQMLPGIGMGRVGFEAGLPLYESANGVHLARDWSLQLTAAIAF